MGSVYYPSRFLCTSCHLQSSHKTMSLTVHSPPILGLKGPSVYFNGRGLNMSPKISGDSQITGFYISCAMNKAAGQSDDPGGINFANLLSKAREVWDSFPQPVKSFPWNRALDNFIQLILDLVVTVIKYLSVPLLAVTSLSEMSYCAHQKKLFLVPIPFLIGVVIGRILSETALELSPLLKDAEVPWHLITIAIFFTLIKFPGPYYPYWGRLLIPHVTNGVLWSTLWYGFSWHRRPRKVPGASSSQSSIKGSNSESNQKI